jgi:DNA-directed RNA polymerase, mitochondrial
MTFHSRTLTEERYDKRMERTARDMGFGSTDGALAIVEKYLDETHKAILETLNDNSKTPKDIRELISEVDPYVLTLVVMQYALTSVAQCDNMTKTIRLLGNALEREVYANGMRNHDGKMYSRIEARVRKTHGSLKYRKQAFRSIAQKAGYKFKGWTDKERCKAGVWLLGCVLDGSVFVLGESDLTGRYVTITEEALAVSDKMVSVMMDRAPLLMPNLTKPDDWTSLERTIDGYRVRLVRRHDRVTQSVLERAIKTGQLGRVLEAVNAAQSVSYRVNEPILDVIEGAYKAGLMIEGLPPANDIPIPEPDVPWDTMDQKLRRVWMKRRSDTKDLNRSFIGQRLTLERDIETARHIGSNPFWTVLNLDYRGRVYGVPSFNFQRQDYVRSLFRFSDGKALGRDGLQWLKVHLANCGDFGKVSKRPFASRIVWVDTNISHILKVANYPFERSPLNTDPWWFSADKPFMFLAACMELRNALLHPTGPENYPSSLPVSFDGSCSGLQHLCAMTRAEEGLLVNLGHTEQPQDVYQVVADIAAERVKQDLDNAELRFLAERALAHGVNRSLVKRNVMTYSYSSKKFGMAQQQLEDTMKPLEYRVLAGDLPEHPFGADNGYSASRYLASIIYDTIESVVSKPAEAMRFLQGIARTLAHEGKPLVWTTPLGFPVVLRYPVMDTTRLSLFLHDRGVKLRVMPATLVEGKGIDKARAANAVAPSFVHSMDACHLHMVALRATQEGMSLALVHDSFGCHAADADKFRDIIREEFVSLYSEDVLAEVLREATEQVSTNRHRLPTLPTYGSLDIKKVLDAEYAFA